MLVRKRLPNTFETSQGLDPLGEKLHNKINNVPRKPGLGGRKLPVPVLDTKGKAFPLGEDTEAGLTMCFPSLLTPLTSQSTGSVQIGAQT